MKRIYYIVGLLIIAVTAFAFIRHSASKEKTSLKNSFKDCFYMGVAINSTQSSGQDMFCGNLIKDQFNSISPENILKWESVHPHPDTYEFTETDKYVKFGEEGMFIIGHTLIWHQQTPAWVVSTSSRKDSSVVLKRIQDHIKTVVGRYKGKIKGWDVVNEALEEDGTLRKSDYLKVLGESYIEKVFQMAAAADPQAELYYNDYNIELPNKREGAIKIIKNLKKKGIRIDGVGIQGHWGLTNPSLEDIETSIIEFSKLGVKVMITELDISVLPNPWDSQAADITLNAGYNKKMDPYAQNLPDSVDYLLTERYKDIFKLFVKHKDKIGRVTFWGLQDGDSWLNNWPIKGRTNYPLLFDRDCKPKKAYYSVIKTSATK